MPVNSVANTSVNMPEMAMARGLPRKPCTSVRSMMNAATYEPTTLAVMYATPSVHDASRFGSRGSGSRRTSRGSTACRATRIASRMA